MEMQYEVIKTCYLQRQRNSQGQHNVSKIVTKSVKVNRQYKEFEDIPRPDLFRPKFRFIPKPLFRSPLPDIASSIPRMEYQFQKKQTETIQQPQKQETYSPPPVRKIFVFERNMSKQQQICDDELYIDLVQIIPKMLQINSMKMIKQSFYCRRLHFRPVEKVQKCFNQTVCYFRLEAKKGCYIAPKIKFDNKEKPRSSCAMQKEQSIKVKTGALKISHNKKIQMSFQLQSVNNVTIIQLKKMLRQNIPTSAQEVIKQLGQPKKKSDEGEMQEVWIEDEICMKCSRKCFPMLSCNIKPSIQQQKYQNLGNILSRILRNQIPSILHTIIPANSLIRTKQEQDNADEQQRNVIYFVENLQQQLLQSEKENSNLKQIPFDFNYMKAPELYKSVKVNYKKQNPRELQDLSEFKIDAVEEAESYSNFLNAVISNQEAFKNNHIFRVEFMRGAEMRLKAQINQLQNIKLAQLLLKMFDSFRNEFVVHLLDVESIKRTIEKMINYCLDLSCGRQNQLVEKYNQLQEQGTVVALSQLEVLVQQIQDEEAFQEQIQTLTSCEEIQECYVAYCKICGIEPNFQ